MDTRKIFRFLHALGLIALLNTAHIDNPLHADDTEIYTAVLDGGFSEQVRPNILYVIDTSGSMDNRFDVNPIEWYESPYDPAHSYPGTCNRDLVYRISAGAVNPDGTHVVSDDGYPVNADGSFQMPECGSFYFPANQLFCKRAIDALADPDKGWYFDRWGEHVEETDEDTGITTFEWKSLSGTRKNNPIPRECHGDQGYHGDVDGAPETYPANIAVGWVSSPTHEKAAPLGGKDRYLVASGNFLNWFNTVQTRIAIVQIALRRVIRDLPPTVNVGLMRFDSAAGGSGSNGGMMIKEFGMIGEGNHRQELINALMSIPQQLDAATPLAETMLEALYVFSGSNAYWGLISDGDDGLPFPSVPASRRTDNSRRYLSPITESCQQNSIVYMTDGAADSDDSAFDGASDADSALSPTWRGGIDQLGSMDYAPLLPNYASYLVPVTDIVGGVSTEFHCSAGNNNYCLPTLSNYMRHADIAPHVAGMQNVITHTIGFAPNGTGDPPDPDYLELTAEYGDGKSALVTDGDQLEDAFRITTREAVIANTAFTAPALAVNAFNRTRDENRVYFAMFKSSTSPGWGGNLKAYQFGRGDDGGLVIVDASGKPAIHEESGQFNFDARSIWSASADGNDAPVGGAASRLPATRSLYTWFAGGGPDIRTAANEFTTGNGSITASMLGMNGTEIGAVSRDNIINWLRGEDVLNADGDDATTQRLHIGDPLHSRPGVITYGGAPENPDQRVFVTTNDGFLHVVDAATGEETFGFIAEETLRNAKQLFTDDTSVSGKVYGLDGVPVLLVDEAGADEPGISGGDRVYLYTGMRRGGRSYYAFDFTDPEYPKLQWRIQGGDVNGNGAADDSYYRLGYTFSTPRSGEIKIDGTPRKILVIGGGYDLDQDRPNGAGSTQDSYLQDDYGNAIYIIDALTGTRLWWASSSVDANLYISDMKNSIPSDVALVDSDNDGWSDRVYVGDTGGRVFRIDINEFSTGGTVQASGGMIADLGASGVPLDPVNENVANNRKFFYAPDVSMVENGVDDYLAIAIGSGNRAHPSYPIGSDTATQDTFFVLKDSHILGRPPGGDYGYGINLGVLFDVSGNELLSDDALVRAPAEAQLNNAKGWYLPMEHVGEKVLAESTTFNYTVMFSSFEPQDIDLATCQARTGIGRLYALNLRNGNPAYDLDGDEDMTGGDRSHILARDGIPPAPTLAFPDENGGQPVIMVGPEMPPISPGGNFRRSYWLIPEAEETP